MDEAFEAWLSENEAHPYLSKANTLWLKEVFAAGWEAGYDEGKMDGSLSELEHQQASENY